MSKALIIIILIIIAGGITLYVSSSSESGVAVTPASDIEPASDSYNYADDFTATVDGEAESPYRRACLDSGFNFEDVQGNYCYSYADDASVADSLRAFCDSQGLGWVEYTPENSPVAIVQCG